MMSKLTPLILKNFTRKNLPNTTFNFQWMGCLFLKHPLQIQTTPPIPNTPSNDSKHPFWFRTPPPIPNTLSNKYIICVLLPDAYSYTTRPLLVIIFMVLIRIKNDMRFEISCAHYFFPDWPRWASMLNFRSNYLVLVIPLAQYFSA